MKIGSVKHKGMKKFMKTGSAAGLPAPFVEKIRTILAFLQAMAAEDELRTLPVWKPHMLHGDRAGAWGLHVTGNWRVTFKIDPDGPQIVDLNYEDYH